MAGIFIMFMCGAFIGYLIARVVHRPKPAGNLRIDNSDPDGTYFFLELSSEAAPKVFKQKYVTFEVKAENYISQQ